MPRVPPLALEELSPEQRRLHDAIGSSRTRVGGPFAIWLRRPAIADAANRLGNALRRDGKLDKRLFELMVLVIARHWSAHYEWFAHEPAARAAGLSDAVVAALRDGQTPAFARDDEQLIYDLVAELMRGGTLADATYARALALFGLELLIEVVTAIGFYTCVGMVLNAFDAPTPDGSRPLG